MENDRNDQNGLNERPALHSLLHRTPSGPPTLVLMHFLGGSTHEWDEVVALLGPAYSTLRLDLPGFGGSAGVAGYTVQEMADAVLACVRQAGLERFVLVGHSMSGKVAMVLARRLEDEPKLSSGTLVGLVLVAPSPPAPEPIPDEKRSSMLGLFRGGPAKDLENASSYITKNDERDIARTVETRAAHEVLRMDRRAWTAWLTSGSKEDWAERVAVLALPALVVAGELDRSLGPAQQQQLTLPHLGRGRLVVVPGCSHLVPLERPETMAELLRKFLAESRAGQPGVPAGYLALIASERVSPRTRQVLEARMAAQDSQQAATHKAVLNAAQQRTLRSMLARILPQRAEEAVDLTAAIVARLAKGQGNGWRYAVLPEDLQAYREGLDGLGAEGFADLTPAEQDAALRRLDTPQGSAQAHWFEEVRSDAVEAWTANPASLARIGYSGIGVGGAHTPHQGFVSLGANQREAWEPVAAAAE